MNKDQKNNQSNQLNKFLRFMVGAGYAARDSLKGQMQTMQKSDIFDEKKAKQAFEKGVEKIQNQTQKTAEKIKEKTSKKDKK